MIEQFSGGKPAGVPPMIFFILVLWFGACYMYIAPFFYDRMTLPLRDNLAKNVYNKYVLDDIGYSKSNAENYSRCLYSKYFYENRFDITLWISSFGVFNKLSSDEMKGRLIEIHQEEKCGKKL